MYLFIFISVSLFICLFSLLYLAILFLFWPSVFPFICLSVCQLHLWLGRLVSDGPQPGFLLVVLPEHLLPNSGHKLVQQTATASSDNKEKVFAFFQSTLFWGSNFSDDLSFFPVAKVSYSSFPTLNRVQGYALSLRPVLACSSSCKKHSRALAYPEPPSLYSWKETAWLQWPKSIKRWNHD